MNNVYTAWELSLATNADKAYNFLLDMERKNKTNLKEIAKEIAFDPDEVFGELENVNYIDGIVYASEESNRSQIKFWKSFANYYSAENTIQYIAESDDNGEFYTNKPGYKDTYKVDGYENYPEIEELYTVDKFYCMDENTFKNMLNHLVGRNDNIDEQIEILTDKYEDLLIHEWEIAELNELY